MDGTLVDNFIAIHQAFAYAHEQLGKKPPTLEKVKRSIGESAPVTMGKLIGHDLAAQALPHFYAYFEEHKLDGLRTYPGAKWLIDRLREDGIACAIFTNKRADIARAISDHLGLSDQLSAIIGTNDNDWRKPQKAFTQYALDCLKTTAETSAIIGDSIYDLNAAKVCGLKAWLVTTGSHTAKQLLGETPQADGVFDDLYALGGHVFAYQKQ